MKNQLIGSFLFLLALTGCQKELTDPADQLVDGCIGVSFYYLDNQSSRDLSGEFVGPRLNGQLDPATLIASLQRVLIGQSTGFGSIPKPADTFSSITLQALVDGKRSTVYTQSPVQTTLWIKKKQNPTDPDFGCQRVDYTLTITDDLLR